MKESFSKLSFFTYLFIFLFSHSGNVVQSGPNRGCHYSKATQSRHCHPERLKKKISKSVKEENTSTYKRSLYPHWIDRDGDCQNERQELLIGRSLIPAIFKINKKGKSCTVKSGTWRDYYYKELLTEASEVDVDHIVPLKYAHQAGAYLWTKKKRRVFANDPDNLVLTNKKYNRQKGAKSPLEWLPIDKVFACKYFKQWLLVKDKYQLNVSSVELSEFKKMKCQNLGIRK